MADRGRARHIPDDLLIQILHPLPTKSLCRFQCVSRSWAALISRRRTFLPMSGLCFSPVRNPFRPGDRRRFYASIVSGEQGEYDRRKFESFLLPFLSTSALLHGCNGLFLFLNTDSVGIFKYSVCNPATMECVALPDLIRRRGLNSYPFLAYDPRESPHYTVLSFTKELEKCATLEIYSSMTGEWVKRRLAHGPGLRFSRSMPCSVYLNGALYMMHKPHLARYHVKRGSLQLLKLPNKSPTPIISTSHMAVSRGHLYYVVIYHSPIKIETWMHEEEDGNGERWLPKHSIEREHLPIGFAVDEHDDTIMFLAMHPDLEVIYLLIYNQVDSSNRILSYRHDNGCLEEFCRITDIVSWTSAFAVTPSLESIDPPGSTIFRW